MKNKILTELNRKLNTLKYAGGILVGSLNLHRYLLSAKGDTPWVFEHAGQYLKTIPVKFKHLYANNQNVYGTNGDFPVSGNSTSAAGRYFPRVPGHTPELLRHMFRFVRDIPEKNIHAWVSAGLPPMGKYGLYQCRNQMSECPGRMSRYCVHAAAIPECMFKTLRGIQLSMRGPPTGMNKFPEYTGNMYADLRDLSQDTGGLSHYLGGLSQKIYRVYIFPVTLAITVRRISLCCINICNLVE